ncbi:uncharacterized protein TRUGW13939_01954 [Talaromyces rugulosus]|uniref:Uncharacterized protein n=1 Tax=Talaromyces rugulosus TaxID=121627 RepID=A0A7H8QLV9_TALRU|nr:uncharacterized protein TRUGW13939_01954 [Talaromyces rugulosus]QKX54864.1 hypothetical protein TRUGW13939_01954 [Talaromyces rugulosus]
MLLLLHRDAFTGAESRLASRLTISVPASNRHLGSVRASQWCTGWPYWRGSRGRRGAREDDLDEMSRKLQELYTKISHINKRNLAHHNHWRGWGKHDHTSENHRGRWRAGRDRNERKNKSPSGQRGEFDDIMKKIEADPYEFLFGRSNEYLRLPKAWSPFCRSFLNIGGSAREAQPNTGSSAGEKAAKKGVVIDHDSKHADILSSDSNVTDSVTPAVHGPELQFDPISGKMIPRSQTVDKETTNENEYIDIPVKAFSSSETSSPEKHDLPSDKMVDAPFQNTSRNDIIYLEDASNYTHKSADGKASVVSTQKPDIDRQASSPITDPKIRQFSDFDDEDISQLSASDIRASFASRNEISNDSVESTHDASTEQQQQQQQVNEAAKHVKGFSGNMHLLNQELTDLCARLEEYSSADVVEPDLYRVLAYDPSTSEVVIAETTSSIHATGATLPPSEVMLSINNPAKFLPYFAKMKNDGYEIVSGGDNILVFRKGPFGSGSDFISTQSAPSRISNMPMGSQAEAKANTLSNADDLIQPIKAEPNPSSNSTTTTTPRIVRRQETIYTGGPPNWSPYPPPSPSYNLDEEISSLKTKSESSFGKTIRRVFLTGFATAGVLYAVGVVCEYFRTGGQDGLGPEGFTAFEAERKRRD